MKSIEEKTCEKYIKQFELPENRRIPDSNYIDWAKFGAKESQAFISINDELPEDNEFLLLPENGQVYSVIKTKEVIVKFASGKYEIATRCRALHDTYYFWSCSENQVSRKITHWRPINYE